MKKLEQREWAFIDDIVYFIYSNDNFINDRKTFLSYINQLIPNNFSVFHMPDKTGEHLLCDTIIYIPGEANGANSSHIEAINRYIEEYEEEDFGKWIMLVGKRDVYREMDLIDDDEIRTTGYFNDTYAAFNIKYSLQVISAFNNQFQAAIVLGRSKENGDFSDKEIYMMELINRHLSLKLYQDSLKNNTENNHAYTHLDEKIMKMADKCMLTKRETEVVFKVVKESLTNDEICSSLCIAGHTLNKHLSNIYIKCDVNSRVSLIHKVLS